MISFSDTVAWLSDDLSARVVVQHSRAVVQHYHKKYEKRSVMRNVQ
jgi:hypothetical protein